MIRTKLITLFVVGMLVLTGCSEHASVRMIEGDYSYKTSGSVIVGDSLEVTLQLPDEIGALTIVSLHTQENKDSVQLIFNPLNGPVYNTTGVISGNEISIVPFRRYIKVDLTEFAIEVSGEAVRHDNTLLFHWDYTGNSILLQSSLKSEDVITFAKRN